MKYRKKRTSGKLDLSACRAAIGKAARPSRRAPVISCPLSGNRSVRSGRRISPPPTPRRSIVQNYIEQRAVYLQGSLGTAGIVNEAQLPEPVHEKADPRTRGPNHFGQSLLTDLRHHGFRDPFFAEASE